MAFNGFGSTNALQHMSYHYSNYHSNDNAIIIWNNEIFYDYAGHAFLALTVMSKIQNPLPINFYSF